MRCMVTGGLGYIGAHLAQELVTKHGCEVTIVDDLSTGLLERNVLNLEFFKLDITDSTRVANLFQSKKFDAVFHLAAKKSIEESISDPKGYFQTNVIGTENLLQNSKLTGVKNFVFASTCAVYGEVLKINPHVKEDDEVFPSNVYGETKLLAEDAVKVYSKDLDTFVFRFFNVIGSADRNMMDTESGSILSNLIDCAKSNRSFTIFGNDYLTRDGTCVRDYIDVRDVSRAMASTLRSFDYPSTGSQVFNLGSQHGTTVLEMVDEFSLQFGETIPYSFSPRRAGDIPIIMSDATKVSTEMNFSPAYSLRDSLASICYLIKS